MAMLKRPMSLPATASPSVESFPDPDYNRIARAEGRGPPATRYNEGLSGHSTTGVGDCITTLGFVDLSGLDDICIPQSTHLSRAHRPLTDRHRR